MRDWFRLFGLFLLATAMPGSPHTKAMIFELLAALTAPSAKSDEMAGYG
jgi:hypothetical protein